MMTMIMCLVATRRRHCELFAIILWGTLGVTCVAYIYPNYTRVTALLSLLHTNMTQHKHWHSLVEGWRRTDWRETIRK